MWTMSLTPITVILGTLFAVGYTTAEAIVDIIKGEDK